MLVPLRLTFGGSSNASEFCNCSETVCDITNELLHCKDWDPSEIYSSIQSQIPSTPLTLDSSIPFAESLPFAVDVPTETIGKADNFIDDLIVIILGDPGNISRGNAAAALALELVSRPHMRKNRFSAAIWLLSANSLPKVDWKKSKQSWDGLSTPVAYSYLYQKTSTKNGQQISYK